MEPKKPALRRPQSKPRLPNTARVSIVETEEAQQKNVLRALAEAASPGQKLKVPKIQPVQDLGDMAATESANEEHNNSNNDCNEGKDEEETKNDSPLEIDFDDSATISTIDYSTLLPALTFSNESLQTAIEDDAQYREKENLGSQLEQDISLVIFRSIVSPQLEPFANANLDIALTRSSDTDVRMCLYQLRQELLGLTGQFYAQKYALQKGKGSDLKLGLTPLSLFKEQDFEFSHPSDVRAYTGLESDELLRVWASYIFPLVDDLFGSSIPDSNLKQAAESPATEADSITCHLNGIKVHLDIVTDHMCQLDYETWTGTLAGRKTFGGETLHQRLTWFINKEKEELEQVNISTWATHFETMLDGSGMCKPCQAENLDTFLTADQDTASVSGSEDDPVVFTDCQECGRDAEEVDPETLELLNRCFPLFRWMHGRVLEAVKRIQSSDGTETVSIARLVAISVVRVIYQNCAVLMRDICESTVRLSKGQISRKERPAGKPSQLSLPPEAGKRALVGEDGNLTPLKRQKLSDSQEDDESEDSEEE